MPSRATSAFQQTVRTALHERASDYVMWVAGHGGDTETINNYIDAVRTFPSHFNEWAANKSRATILNSIPLLRSLLPGLTSGHVTADSAEPSDAVPLPKNIEVVVTLALQQSILAKDNDRRCRSPLTRDGNALSGLWNPPNHVDLLATNFGYGNKNVPFEVNPNFSFAPDITPGVGAMGNPTISGVHHPIIEAAIYADEIKGRTDE